MPIDIYTIKEPPSAACATFIWMHGLGASGEDMSHLVTALQIDALPIRHIFLNAPIQPVTINGGMRMPAWYDILGDQLIDREDERGILATEAGLREVISHELAKGISSRAIYLAGFSQGGAMALHTGLRYPEPLGGIVVLSAYLPLIYTVNQHFPDQNLSTPVFLAIGTEDPIIPCEWTRASITLLIKKGCTRLEWCTYPMMHSTCAEELKDLNAWISKQVKTQL